MNENESTKWLTLTEVADELRVHPVTLRVWIGTGDAPPATKVGRSWRFSRVALDAWLTKQTTLGTEEE